MHLQKIFTKIIFLIILLVTLNSCDKEENPTVMNISIKSPPNVVDYVEGEQKLDLEGFEIILHYNNTDEKTIGFKKFAENDIICKPAHEEILPIGANNIEIIHKPSESLIKQQITVSEITVSEVTIKNLPEKSKYFLGEALDIDGIKLLLRYNNGNEEIVEMDEFESNNIECSVSNGTILNNSNAEFIINHSKTGIKLELPIEFETLTDIENNIYPLSKIGTQIWMAENLRTSKLNDGTAIPYVIPDEYQDVWSGLETPAFDWIESKEYAEQSKLGAYYNYHTIETEKICPSNWHVPSFEEWQTLLNFLSINGFQNTEGEALKSFEGWESVYSDDAFNGLNTYGFDARPGGAIAAGGIIFLPNGNIGDIYKYVGNYGKWWTSTKDNSGQAKLLSLDGGTNYVIFNTTQNGSNYSLQSGINVRCIKD